jgi:transposase, IS5 family
VQDNPYDGHTLKESIEQAERLTQVKVTDACVDQGYRGKTHHPEHVNVLVTGSWRLPRSLKKLLRGRAGIEPIIGHLKAEP